MRRVSIHPLIPNMELNGKNHSAALLLSFLFVRHLATFVIRVFTFWVPRSPLS